MNIKGNGQRVIDARNIERHFGNVLVVPAAFVNGKRVYNNPDTVFARRVPFAKLREAYGVR